MDKDQSLTFYVDLPEGEIDQLKLYLLRYIDERTAKYLITHEISSVSKKSHYHFVVEMSVKNYEKFRDNIIKKKYKLSARKGEDGQGKQYGKVTNIRDINKMITYCLKDEGERRTNLSDEDINDFLRASFKKDEEKEHIQILIEKMPKISINYTMDVERDMKIQIQGRKIYIIDYFRKNNLEFNWRKIDRIFELFLAKQDLTSERIYEFMRLKQKNII